VHIQFHVYMTGKKAGFYAVWNMERIEGKKEEYGKILAFPDNLSLF